ncbi:MAG: lipoate--protein ligase family protein [Planctomycetota bacterium]
MKLLDLTLPTAAENVALDEALLEEAEQGGGPGELLRLWEPSSPSVVIGRSSRLAEEVNVEACQELGIPILRRCSGGAAIVAGPGCLMYSVILSYTQRPQLRMLDQAHGFVLGVLRKALTSLAPDVVMMGTSDLARHGYKFSGNSLRCKRDFFLYHGTILHRFPLWLISQCLAAAPRQPDYREDRPHHAFVSNFPATAEQLRRVIRQEWSIQETISHWPRHQVARLVAQRYARDHWNRRL